MKRRAIGLGFIVVILSCVILSNLTRRYIEAEDIPAIHLHLTSAEKKRLEETEAARPPIRIATTLPAVISMRVELPLTVTLTYESDCTRNLTNYSFMFIVLDQSGRQISIDSLIREANVIRVPMVGREPKYKPRLIFYYDIKNLHVGQNYQLITIVPDYRLASAAWFTLAP